MYTIHPLTVHLPIGLLIGNALLTLLYLRRGDKSHEIAAFHCLWLGTLLLLPAVVTGTYAAVQSLFDPVRPRTDALAWMNAHAIAGVAVIVVYWQAWQQRRRNPALLDDQTQRRGYLGLLIAGVLLLVVTGWLGGQMVYSLGVGVDGA